MGFRNSGDPKEPPAHHKRARQFLYGNPMYRHVFSLFHINPVCGATNDFGASRKGGTRRQKFFRFLSNSLGFYKNSLIIFECFSSCRKFLQRADGNPETPKNLLPSLNHFATLRDPLIISETLCEATNLRKMSFSRS